MDTHTEIFFGKESSLGQNNRERTKKIFKIIFQSKVTEVYLISCSNLKEQICNFSLKKNFEIFSLARCP